MYFQNGGHQIQDGRHAMYIWYFQLENRSNTNSTPQFTINMTMSTSYWEFIDFIYIAASLCAVLSCPKPSQANGEEVTCSEVYRHLTFCVFKCLPGHRLPVNGTYNVSCEATPVGVQWDDALADCESKNA